MGKNKALKSAANSVERSKLKKDTPNKPQPHLDDPLTEDTSLAEEELLVMEDGDSRPAEPDSKEHKGMIMVPRISVLGSTADHLVSGRKSPIQMIPVKDDRTDSLTKLSRTRYVRLVMPLHVELLKVQNYVKENRLKVVVLFEGRDAAGKGGTIKRFIEHMNPRGCRVVALEKPSVEERNQWYFQRYVKHLPTAGEIVLFDRSWYNRAMVERVMGFYKPDEVGEFLRSTPEFERMLIRSGIILIKYYFSVSKKEQLRRFQRRLNHPLKQWKLSPVDLESQDKWEDYKRAKEDVFYHTSTPESPWIVIKSDQKKRARINAIRHFVSRFDYPKDFPQMLEHDPRIVRAVSEELQDAAVR